MLAVGRRHRIWRVNSGKFFHVDRPCADCKARGRWIQGAPKGAADLVGIIDNGRHLHVEVKSARGVQTQEQASWERMVTSRGGVYVLARSVEDVTRVLAP